MAAHIPGPLEESRIWLAAVQRFPHVDGQPDREREILRHVRSLEEHIPLKHLSAYDQVCAMLRDLIPEE